MIWLGSSVSRSDAVSVRGELLAGWEPLLRPYLRMPERLEDVCAAVATVWESDYRGLPVPARALELMATRVLWMAEEHAAARGLARHAAADPDHAEGWMRMVERGGPSLSACLCLGGGLVRPVRTAVDATVPAWVLDVGRLATAGGELAEMGIPLRMVRVIRRTAEIWDGTSGRGILLLSGGPRPAHRIRTLLRTTGAAVCREALERLARERTWADVPRVRAADVR